MRDNIQDNSKPSVNSYVNTQKSNYYVKAHQQLTPEQARATHNDRQTTGDNTNTHDDEKDVISTDRQWLMHCLFQIESLRKEVERISQRVDALQKEEQQRKQKSEEFKTKIGMAILVSFLVFGVICLFWL